TGSTIFRASARSSPARGPSSGRTTASTTSRGAGPILTTPSALPDSRAIGPAARPSRSAPSRECQVSGPPSALRQGNFVGAGVNTVTRSGNNSFAGSAYYWFRNQGGVGTKAKDLTFNPGTFKFHKGGGWLSGPVVKNKLFFFASVEPWESLTQPGT